MNKVNETGYTITKPFGDWEYVCKRSSFQINHGTPYTHNSIRKNLISKAHEELFY